MSGGGPVPAPKRAATILSARDLDAPVALSFARGTVLAFTMRGPGKEANDDAAAVLPVGDGAGVLAVADGLGGHAQGARASEILVGALAEAVARCDGEPSGLRESVLDGVERAHREILALGTGAGTTLAAAIVHAGALRPLHAGDSAVIVVGQRGRIRLETLLHSPTGYAVEAGYLEAHDALDHEERHLVSNYVGYEGMHLQIGSLVELARRDSVLVASDGLLDNLRMAEIATCIRKGDPAKAAERLRALAARRMAGGEEGAPCKPDDLTFLLFRPTPPAGWKPPEPAPPS